MKFKRIVLLKFFLLCAGIATSSAQGINFFKGSFDEVKAEAKKQNKLIFIDFYTVWCGPCKAMDANVFPLTEVGDFFNAHYINYKLDAEKEGRELAKRYNVTAYPTYMFLRVDGSELSKATGSMSKDKFISLGQNAHASASDPNNLSSLKSQYEAHKQDPGFLRMYIDKMIENKEAPFEALDSYLKYQKEMDEASSKMMVFLIKYSDYLLLGGEAERILKHNFFNYKEIAAKMESSQLDNAVSEMLKMSRRIALRDGDVKLYRNFLKSWKEFFPEVKDQIGVPYHLELLQLEGNKNAYREMAFRYLDSLVSVKPVAQIKLEDKAHYTKYSEINPISDNFMIKAYHEMNKDREAKKFVVNITSVGDKLVKYSTKEDLNRFLHWVSFCKQLLPDNVEVKNFEVNLMYALMGKEKGITAKRALLKELGSSKKAGLVREELKKMEAGNFLK